MLAQRAAQQSLRKLAAQPAHSLIFRNIAAPIAARSGALVQSRPVATQQISAANSYEILAEQRKKRPTSPHLLIYRPQITWYLSMSHRITGSVLSGAFYIFGSAYLISPLMGWHLDSATLAATFGSLPWAVKGAAKLFAVFPFVFHSLNGCRHLVWDFGKQMTNKAVNTTGWFVVGLSTITSLGLVLFV